MKRVIQAFAENLFCATSNASEDEKWLGKVQECGWPFA